MKSLILAGASAVALLSFGSAMAAPTSSIDQTGANMNATVDQITATNGESVVIQGFPDAAASGAQKDQTANVTQQGTGKQRADIIQGRDASPGTGVINLFGGASPTGNSGNVAKTTQNGSNLDAFSYQYGLGNKATISQSGTGKPFGDNGLHNVGNVGVAEGWAVANESAAGVSSGLNDMNNAGATIVQDHAVKNDASITQAGSNAGARITQYLSLASKASTNQNGTDLRASTIQEGYKQTATVTQTGTDQKARVEQIPATFVFGLPFGGANVATLTQANIGNRGSIVQSGSLGSATTNQQGSNSSADVTQSGISDTSTVLQTASANAAQATVVQKGLSDTSAITQGGGYGNIANVTQNGNFEVSTIAQTGGLAGTHNTADVTQSLAGAASVINQTGSDLHSTVNQ